MRILFLAVCAVACGPHHGDGSNMPPPPPDGGGACSDGVTRCEGQTFMTCSGRKFEVTLECPKACMDMLGCVECQPGAGTCSGTTAAVCRDDGSGWDELLCDPVQGLTCDPDTGQCAGPCAPETLGPSYMGCEYYPTVTGNAVLDHFQFAVAVANTSSETASITVEEGALAAPLTFQVAPGQVAVQKLPWVVELKLCTNTQPPDPLVNRECKPIARASALKSRGAYHLRSTRPVTVYQFNPLDYTDGMDNFSFSNDASLLLPTNALTGNYIAAAWPAWDAPNLLTFPSLVTITAVADDTKVTVTARASTAGDGGAPTFSATMPATITLQRGDVLELGSLIGDLTGSIVAASKPVQVIGGHYCTNIPALLRACDHLEESMFPVETLSTRYVVTAPFVPSLGRPKEQFTRVVATQAQTTVTFEPAPEGMPGTMVLASPGDMVEVARSEQDFVITADHKVLVAHYMEAQDAGGQMGDPAFTLAVPIDQYRTSYLFHAPANYEANYVNITVPSGESVILDGTAVSGFIPIAGEFEVARVALGPGDGGNHLASSNVPFGITVYGYGTYTSYWYPGGLDLAEIPVQ